MKKVKTILRLVIFVIIGILIFWILTNIILPKTAYTTIIGEFYEEPENSLDVVFIGDSSIYRGISPLEIWKRHGITSYNFSSPAQRIWDGYYCLQEVLKYQKPKIVVLNIEALFLEEPMKNEYQRHLYDNMKPSKNKVNAISDSVEKIDRTRQISFFVTLLRFHDRWKELEDRDFECMLGQTYHSKDVFKGYWINLDILPYKKGEQYKLNNKISEKEVKYLKKIQNICKQNNIQLLLFEAPTAKEWNTERHQAVAKLARENNLIFLDSNQVMREIGIDWEKDTFDGGIHLNVDGAQKVTNYVGDFLAHNYQLPNHKRESHYQSWNQELKRYEERIQELKEEAEEIKNKKDKKQDSQINRTKKVVDKNKIEKLKKQKVKNL